MAGGWGSDFEFGVQSVALASGVYYLVSRVQFCLYSRVWSMDRASGVWHLAFKGLGSDSGSGF